MALLENTNRVVHISELGRHAVEMGARPMFEKCNAFIVGVTERQNASLAALAHKVGFASVVDALHQERRLAGSSSQGINYFFLHYKVDDFAKKSVISTIRASDSAAVRFAPIVLIIDDCPFETVLSYVQFGFDDVISLPEKADVMAQRLAGQLNMSHLYIETADYLGPDRRRMERSIDRHEMRGKGERSHIRYLIRRNPDAGIEILQKMLCS